MSTGSKPIMRKVVKEFFFKKEFHSKKHNMTVKRWDVIFEDGFVGEVIVKPGEEFSGYEPKKEVYFRVAYQSNMGNEIELVKDSDLINPEIAMPSIGENTQIALGALKAAATVYHKNSGGEVKLGGASTVLETAEFFFNWIKSKSNTA